MQTYNLNHLQELEAEAIHIMRETVTEFKNPVMLYSIGKDSTVLLHLAKKAFAPGKVPFPLLHVDTGFKFDEMIEFRDRMAKEAQVRLIVQKNESEEARAMNPEEAHTERYIYHKKTKPLLDALNEHGFDAAIGGARREEEKARAKERIFSFRNTAGNWDPKGQRPELWHLYNTRLNQGESMRVFPLSNWREIDIWHYIREEGIEVVPLYFAKKWPVIKRNGIYVRVDRITQAKKGEVVEEKICRYRTLGCAPSTGAVLSAATNVDEIIKELKSVNVSERITRAIDANSDHAMEQKKREGYF